MKKKIRSVTAALTAAMMISAMPARASGDSTLAIFGLLAVIGATFGIVAWQHDSGKGNEPLTAPDQTGRDKKKDGARIEIVPPPSSRDDEARPNEVAAGIALCAKF